MKQETIKNHISNSKIDLMYALSAIYEHIAEEARYNDVNDKIQLLVNKAADLRVVISQLEALMAE